MGGKQDWSLLRSRIEGKWQLPLLAISMALFAATIYRTRPQVPVTSFKDALAEIDAYLDRADLPAALSRARELVDRVDLTESQKAQVELRLGRARYRMAERSVRPQSPLASQIERHFRAASKELESPPLDAEDIAALGRLSIWQLDFSEAVARLNQAVALNHPRSEELLRDIYVLRRDRLESPPEILSQELDSLLARLPAHRLDVRIWLVEQRFELASRSGRLSDFGAFLGSEAAIFEESDFGPRFELVRCRQFIAEGNKKEAELRLRALRNQVDPAGEVGSAAGWLLGTLLVEEGSPEKVSEGLSFFSDVLDETAEGPYVVASLVGQGAALARLSRHEESISAYREALRKLGSSATDRVVDLSALRGSLIVTAETLRQRGDLKRAIEYAAMSAELAESGTDSEKTLFTLPLAAMKEELAENLRLRTYPPHVRDEGIAVRDSESAALYASAAGHFDHLAQWNVLQEEQNAEFSWKAAELWGKAGQTDEAIRRYRDFVLDRPNDRRGPTAMLRIGHLHATSGRLAEAVDAFQECNRRYPRSFDGARSLIPLSRTYLAMGPERFGDAERALLVVLDDSDVFTPEAGEFVEALFLLGEVLERGERYEPAISRLQEAVDRYPDDPRALRGRFLLGGAYRKSAFDLRAEAAEATDAGELTRVREESHRRFEAARLAYRQLISRLEYRGISELDERERLYLEHSYLYEADCYFETQRYADALKHYEQAAGTLRESTRGLSAHVQMINCLVYLGQMREARVALARAMVVVSTLPDGAFQNRIASESRENWKSYFEWLEASELFVSG